MGEVGESFELNNVIVSPLDFEQIINEHELIAESAVVPYKHPIIGNIPLVFATICIPKPPEEGGEAKAEEEGGDGEEAKPEEEKKEEPAAEAKTPEEEGEKKPMTPEEIKH